MGLLPLCATIFLEADQCAISLRNSRSDSTGAHPELHVRQTGVADRRLMSIVNEMGLRRVLAKLLGEQEFLNPCSSRSISRYHADNPYIISAGGQVHRFPICRQSPRAIYSLDRSRRAAHANVCNPGHCGGIHESRKVLRRRPVRRVGDVCCPLFCRRSVNANPARIARGLSASSRDANRRRGSCVRSSGSPRTSRSSFSSRRHDRSTRGRQQYSHEEHRYGPAQENRA
jgi:hypothetical protein